MTVIQGILRCITPLHSATESTKNADGTNVTRTAIQSIFTKSGREDVPYYKATSQRGGLRRAAARIVLDRLTLDEKISRALFSGMMTGSESGTPDNAQLTVEEAIRAKNNVFMGLFGGGARILKSRYRPTDMMPVIPSTVEIGIVPKRYVENEQNWMVNARGDQLINTYGFVSVDDVLRLADVREIEKYIDNSLEAVTQYQLSIADNKSARKADKDDKSKSDKEKTKKIDKANMLSFEAIAPGVPLFFRLEIDEGVNDAQVGLMLQALTNLINEQEFGGWIRAGLGRVSAHLEISSNGEEYAPLFDTDATDKYVLTEAVRNQYTPALEDALGKLTVEDMVHFYTNRG